MIGLNIVGAGRLGQSVAYLAAGSGRYRIGGVLCRSLARAEAAVAFVGAGTACADFAALPDAELTLIAVPDARIAAVAAALAARDWPAGALVFHASGAGELDLLAPLAARGVAVGCLHPAFSFAEPARAVATFAGTPCALDGDDAAVARLAELACAIGGAPFRLALGGKAAYHAALSVASNYLVTLTSLAGRLAKDAGVPDAAVPGLLGPLMRQTLENALALGPEAALTGPIVRGDVGTVARHLAVLTEPGDAAAYRALGRLTVALADGKLDGAARDALLARLAR
ncbi:putative short-subunit dehydrogenase-like oxidoreductase (DUF2520 family) [Crenobacter luteus]|uniref:Rossmann-like and DUF2520 domain-containing protein n=1 Tax=Crenobacter luteus TaxID=1452487 RepID=UPI001048025C|nr:Rossmann-like and DUF2520 domain-containing protein [Crenobacter luteus]TCP12592.1 putative short-subunit dehydrogenase-like oxidoreductase (DUF2520 family) [Crenobacter luteus]